MNDQHTASGAPTNEPDTPIRVLIVDDQSLVRDGLALIAGSAPDLSLIHISEPTRPY